MAGFMIGPSGVAPAPAGGGGGAEFIGTATVVDNSYAGADVTFTANGGVSLPACLFVCGFASSDVFADPVISIGATSLTRVATDSGENVQLWAALYAGGSDTVTVSAANFFDIMQMATGWSTKSVTATAVSPQSRQYGTLDANNSVRLTLSSPCVVPTSGIGFIVGSCLNVTLGANNRNWANVEVSPAPSDAYTVSNGRISLACISSAGSWSPEFWGSTNSAPQAYDFASGLAACAFGP